MKKIIAAIAAVFACLLFAGCTSAPLTVPTPQQLVTDFCPVVNADLKLLAASPLLNAAQQKVLNGTPGDASNPGIINMNAAVCAAGAVINVTSLQTLNVTAFPALITLVSGLPNLPNQPAILFGLTLAQPILTQIINALPVATVPAAPVAASGTLVA
jgi:hypothetical protein